MSERGSRSSWDSKHRNAGSLGEPSRFLLSLVGELPRGRCLDLAAGRGANALFMAQRGYRVDAIDWSLEALRPAAIEAARQDLAINFLVTDLMSYPLPIDRYEVVLCFRYLQRSLWPHMERALRPGGALLMETFTEEHRRDHPDFPAVYCLKPGELLRAFPLLKIALHHESRGKGTASLLAARP